MKMFQREGLNPEEKNDPIHEASPVFFGANETIASLVKSSRQRKGLSQKELAREVKISPVQLCRIENGDSVPSRDTMKRLSGQLGVPYSKMLVLCGYNNMRGEDVLYKKDGTVLNVDKVVKSIYSADADFLSLFDDFAETIGTPDNIQTLQILLKAMRKEVNMKGAESTVEEISFKNFFGPLKRFLVTSLLPVVGEKD